MRRALLAVVTVALAAPASGAVLCRQRSDVLVARETACRKRETAVAADVGLLAPPGATGDAGADGAAGTAGVPGPAKGWVHVQNSATIAEASHFDAVTRPSTGVHCLTPDATIDVATSVGLVTVDHAYSAGQSLVAYVHFPASDCPAGTFQVDTVDLSGAPSNDVAFVFVAF